MAVALDNLKVLDSLKVMIIDDSKTIRRTAETLLKKVGCDVTTAVDGFDALAKIAGSLVTNTATQALTGCTTTSSSSVASGGNFRLPATGSRPR